MVRVEEEDTQEVVGRQLLVKEVMVVLQDLVQLAVVEVPVQLEVLGLDLREVQEVLEQLLP